jgi:uncharacterized protein (TIGR02145 family)
MINKNYTFRKLEAIGKLVLFVPVLSMISCESGKKENNPTTVERDSTSVEQTLKQIIPLEYKSVAIGTQTWMAENINTQVFRNGDTIPQIKSSEEWIEAGKNGKPAWCYYYDNKEDGDKLYNFYAVTDTRGLAPDGWEVPTVQDYEVLIKHLGGVKVAAPKLKDTEGWTKGANGTNESGFSARPGGMRNFVGAFTNKGEFGYWWTKSERVNSNGWYISIGLKNQLPKPTFSQQANAFSVRCIKK